MSPIAYTCVRLGFSNDGAANINLETWFAKKNRNFARLRTVASIHIVHLHLPLTPAPFTGKCEFCGGRLRWRFLVLTLPASLFLLWTALPYDSSIRLALRFNLNALGSPFTSQRLFVKPPAFPVTISKDAGIILKSGFGTKDRISAWLEWHQERSFVDILVVGDFATQPGQHYNYSGRQLNVHDLLALMLENGSLPPGLSHPRLLKYSNLTAAIATGDTNLALELSKSFGWELDAMKVVIFYRAEHQLVDPFDLFLGLSWPINACHLKKLYILADDDTYIVAPSLEGFLGHFDSNLCYYLGNPVGDYRGRFAHGGSSVILSQATMRRLFGNPEIVSAAHEESLSETWGDKLLATTLIKLGIYLEEGYSRFFNGEPPRSAKLRSDRFCIAIMAFHGLSPLAMLQTGRMFRHAVKPVRWIDLLSIYQALLPDTFTKQSIRQNWDHVGSLDESTKSINVPTAGHCGEACHADSSFCLAWTWELDTQACHMSPWVIVGDNAPGKASGLNTPRVKKLATTC
ncbi:hypothetical protein CPC735_042280 [Coccidioides posadasii C735 delta SOWgp]|uniref:Apple domain-containing protein n=1 Tax=Coccidioides posadasii (strain C735) TaxID=222929 RepID=C5PB00_COCP7|nr:hypothetical protein CPC735_042280 [Coccidioides posadasii C735 delta SOWgp]EER25784.1 hypothetical protein CPC735_042280 [Coccidioides posadasii C735 delta SOWgp]|eukprot:XP_003067929.1 hypothetical protein CPC735_042280 [Coccidioides posadasii C735 delta SOWgp]